jgi:4a-hydroxytetrahydrobiopterin dehydratase
VLLTDFSAVGEELIRYYYSPMATLLTPDEITQKVSELAKWSVQGKELKRQFELPNFAQAMAFVNQVAALAEAKNHHPDIDIRWNKVLLSLSTHSKGGLTDADFDLAAQIDRIES